MDCYGRSFEYLALTFHYDVKQVAFLALLHEDCVCFFDFLHFDTAGQVLKTGGDVIVTVLQEHVFEDLYSF